MRSIFFLCYALTAGASLSAYAQAPKLLLRPTPQPKYGRPVPKRVSGRVVVERRKTTVGAQGVAVTDGFSVVKTDAQGGYVLLPDPRAVFIYITRPAGFDVRGHWYKPLDGKVDFALKPAADNEREYIFVHVTDTHVSGNARSIAGLWRFVKEVNALTPKPRFVVNSGDLLNLNKALTSSPAAGHRDFRNYVGIMNHLTMPHYNVAGDHTDSSYRLKEFPRGHLNCGKPLFWEYLGPHFFSFEYGQIHFVSVDFGYHLGKRKIKVNGKNLDYPTLMVQPPHVKWMNQDMSARSPGTFVIATAEHDLIEFCPNFLKMAKRHDVRLQLLGDTHVVSYKARQVPYRTAGALAGCWWNPRTNQLCPDLSPQGYLIYRVKGEKLEHFYKGLGRRVEITSHRFGAAWQGKVNVRAHLVQPVTNEKLEYTFNGKKWHPMREIGQPFYRTTYAATIDSSKLSDGRVQFRVRSTGTRETRSRTFMVANGKVGANKLKSKATLSFRVGPPTSWTTPRAPSGKVDLLFNGKVLGRLEVGKRKQYSFSVPASLLRHANKLSFRFNKPGDGLSLNAIQLSFRGKVVHDLRDEAIRRVRAAHWGPAAAEWGGFIVGPAAPPDETPFHRRQNIFCFVLEK